MADKPPPTPYELRWRGDEFKWSVQHGATVLRDRFDSRGEAFTWLRDNVEPDVDTLTIKGGRL